MATLPSLGLHACVGRTCKRQALVQRGLRGVDEGDGHLGILRGHESYAQSLYEGKKSQRPGLGEAITCFFD